jgi:cytochrome c553
MKAQNINKKFIALVIAAAAVLTPLALSAAQKPKYTIKEVMKAIHKGEDNIGKRVVKGQASKEDIAKMVEYYESLPLNDPPRGERSSWDAKTTALVNAAHDLKAGKAGALAEYKEAANCKACHTAHKPQDKH